MSQASGSEKEKKVTGETETEKKWYNQDNSTPGDRLNVKAENETEVPDDLPAFRLGKEENGHGPRQGRKWPTPN